MTDPGDGLQVRQVDRVATARGAREKEDVFLDVRGKESAPLASRIDLLEQVLQRRKKGGQR